MAEALADGVVSSPEEVAGLREPDRRREQTPVRHGRRPVRAVPDHRGRAAADDVAGGAAGRGERRARGAGAGGATQTGAGAGQRARPRRSCSAATRSWPGSCATWCRTRSGTRRRTGPWPSRSASTARDAVLAVDDGCGGIPVGELGRVFDVAFRGSAARTPSRSAEEQVGGGLGLAIAKGLVEAHRAGSTRTTTAPAAGSRSGSRWRWPGGASVRGSRPGRALRARGQTSAADARSGAVANAAIPSAKRGPRGEAQLGARGGRVGDHVAHVAGAGAADHHRGRARRRPWPARSPARRRCAGRRSRR